MYSLSGGAVLYPVQLHARETLEIVWPSEKYNEQVYYKPVNKGDI